MKKGVRSALQAGGRRFESDYLHQSISLFISRLRRICQSLQKGHLGVPAKNSIRLEERACAQAQATSGQAYLSVFLPLAQRNDGKDQRRGLFLAVEDCRCPNLSCAGRIFEGTKRQCVRPTPPHVRNDGAARRRPEMRSARSAH